MVPSDPRSLARARAIPLGRALRLRGHRAGFAASASALWVEGHAGGGRSLALPSSLPEAACALEASLGTRGIRVRSDLTSITRLDVAVDLSFADGNEGGAFLAAVRTLKPPRLKPVAFAHPVETVEIAGRSGRRYYGRAYDAGLRHRRAPRGRLIRIETEDRFRRSEQLRPDIIALAFLGDRFRKRFNYLGKGGHEMLVGGYPAIAQVLVLRVARGDLRPQDLGQALEWLTLCAAGLEDTYKKGTRSNRERLVHGLGIAADPTLLEPVYVDVAEAARRALRAWGWWGRRGRR